MKKNQWLTTSELKTLQEKKLKALLRHAYENVPFYHRRLRSLGLVPEDVQGLEDLHKVPITTKQDIEKSFPHNIIAKNFNPEKCFKTHTSGSTGSPMVVLYDKRCSDYLKASMLRYKSILGIKPWDKKAIVRFNDTPTTINQGGILTNLARPVWSSLRRKYSRDFYISYHGRDVVPDLLKFQPDFLYGRPIYLRLIVEELRRTGEKIHPKFIGTRGDVLDGSTRAFLEDSLGCEVYDSYGANDAGPIALQCREREGYHIEADLTICEFLKGGEAVGEGELGDIVVTNLSNYAMPFIRYQVGDVASYLHDKCSCGRTLPLLQSIEGRRSEFLTLSDGEPLSPKQFLGMILDSEMVPRFQIVQRSPHDVSLHVYGDNLSDRTVSSLVAKCKRIFGKGVEIQPSVGGRAKAKLRPIAIR